MNTLIYMCYVVLGSSPVLPECHIEEVVIGPHSEYETNKTVDAWCAGLKRLPPGDTSERLSVCRWYYPGLEKKI